MGARHKMLRNGNGLNRRDFLYSTAVSILAQVAPTNASGAPGFFQLDAPNIPIQVRAASTSVYRLFILSPDIRVRIRRREYETYRHEIDHEFTAQARYWKLLELQSFNDPGKFEM
jgi:hypothetical protein